jgi:hypothetical protein
MKNKRGVIRIIESIIAILVLLSVVLVLIQRQPEKADFSTSVYKVQSSILKEISDSNSYRNYVLAKDKSKIECFIQSRLQKYSLDFNVSICDIDAACYCDSPPAKEVYTADALISGNLTYYNPRRILMCSWIGTLTQRTCAPVGPSCVPTAEVCDNIDNNCNGQIDEGLTTTSGCSQYGVCSGAFKTCSAGVWGACSILPGTEVCGNTIDEDCNGVAEACGAVCGDKLCNGGETCSSCPGDCPAPAASCKNTNSYGTCTGSYVCSAGAWTCNAATPAAESCDGIDNDCDGTTTDEAGICPTVPNCLATDGISMYSFLFTDPTCKPASGCNFVKSIDIGNNKLSIYKVSPEIVYYCSASDNTPCGFGSCSATTIPTNGQDVSGGIPTGTNVKYICVKKLDNTTPCTIRMIKNP